MADISPFVVLWNSYSLRVRLASAWRIFVLALPCFLGRCNLYTYAISLDQIDACSPVMLCDETNVTMIMMLMVLNKMSKQSVFNNPLLHLI